MEVLTFLSNIKHYLSMYFKILNCIQCGLVLNHEFGVEFNVQRNLIYKLFYKRTL